MFHFSERESEIRANRPAVPVAVHDSLRCLFLSALLESTSEPESFLFEQSLSFFSRFVLQIHVVYSVFPRVVPYSFWRGGASSLFRAANSYDRVAEQGRWDSVSAARRYIDEATAAEILFSAPVEWHQRVILAQRTLLEFAPRGGMVGSSVLFDE